ncbi:hypothetical protein [Uliginosibacterium sediminicola]|uniref:Transposase n=1 Tax=Uliginosibacterium sediminicola TaxID=2024550 RepID=A0ABU9YW07_9RHOO
MDQQPNTEAQQEAVPLDCRVERRAPKRADARPRKWFVNEYFGRITQRAVNGWDEIHQRTSGTHYFDTWEQAYAQLKERTAKRLKRAKAELPAAKRAVERVANLKPPNT